MKKKIANVTNTIMSTCVSKCRSQEPDAVGKKKKAPTTKQKQNPAIPARTHPRMIF